MNHTNANRIISEMPEELRSREVSIDPTTGDVRMTIYWDGLKGATGPNGLEDRKHSAICWYRHASGRTSVQVSLYSYAASADDELTDLSTYRVHDTTTVDAEAFANGHHVEDYDVVTEDEATAILAAFGALVEAYHG